MPTLSEALQRTTPWGDTPAQLVSIPYWRFGCCARMLGTRRQIWGDLCGVRAARLIFPEAASSAWSAVRPFSDAVRRAATRTRRLPSSAWNAVTDCRQLPLTQQPRHQRILPPRSLRRLDRLNAASSRSCSATLWVRPRSLLGSTPRTCERSWVAIITAARR